MTCPLLAAGSFSDADFARLFLALTALLITARLLGELARRFRQPAILGEILAGILLGSTVLGRLHPGLFAWLFPLAADPSAPAPPADHNIAVALDGFFKICVTLFMLTAGLELNLTSALRHGRSALLVSATGIIFPFALGVAAAFTVPALMGRTDASDPLLFPLVIGIALSITALPVIVKTLIDLNLFKTDLGALIVSAAMIDDLIGWAGFAMVLAMLHSHGHAGMTVAPDLIGPGMGVLGKLAVVLAFVIFMLTAARWLIHRTLPLIQKFFSFPAAVIAFIITIGLACAAFTSAAGVHAVFGAFIAGIAIGASSHLKPETREALSQFIAAVLAPLFFASIALHVDFLRHFDLPLVLTVTAIAIVSKVGGCWLGARAAGLDQRPSLAVGFAMSSRGAMEIILGQTALAVGLIQEKLFVALVIMALATSLMAGPIMARLLPRPAQ